MMSTNEHIINELQHRISLLEEQIRRASSNIEALEQQHMKLDTELSELEQIILNSTEESRLRVRLIRWLQKKAS